MRIFIWIMWILSAGVLHLFGNNFGTIVILAASVTLPAASLVAVVITSNRADIILELPDRCTKGGKINGYIHFSGSGLFSCSIVCENCFTGELTRQKVKHVRNNKIVFSLETSHCGIIRVASGDLRVFDMFGLFPVKIKKSAEKTITVSPVTFDVNIRITESINAVSDNGEYSVTKSGTDNGEIYAVREYVPGDPIKNIHWKLSEKTDRIMVRDFGTPAENKVLILFEKMIPSGFNLPSASEIDGMAEVLSSVSLKLSKENIRHDIVWKDTKSGIIKKRELDGETGIDLFLTEYISDTPAEGTSTILAFLDLNEQSGYSHAIVISPYISSDSDLLYSYIGRITVLHCAGKNTIRTENIEL